MLEVNEQKRNFTDGIVPIMFDGIQSTSVFPQDAIHKYRTELGELKRHHENYYTISLNCYIIHS